MLSSILIAILTPTCPDAELVRHAPGIPSEEVASLLVEARAAREAEEVDRAREIWRRVIELDPNQQEARHGLGHHAYDEQWFETYTALAKYRRAEEKRMLEEQGLVRFGDGWAAQAEVPFLRMGWTRTGERWLSTSELEAARRAEELAGKGWEQQDLVWIPPTEFDAWRAGQWKCGDQWLSTEEADAWHADPTRPWQVPGEHFVVTSNLDRESVGWIVWWADKTWDDLVRVFGVAPSKTPELVVLDSLATYNAFAAGDANLGLVASDAEGSSSVHYAFFAEANFVPNTTPAEWHGVGVGWWDRHDANLAPYGQHSVRHAAAQSFIEGLDPSWDHISRVVSGGGAFAPKAFWGEKRFPRWLRYGAASYVERYFQEREVEEGGNAWWARDWALTTFKQGGDWIALEELFEFQPDPSDAAASERRIHQSGLVVSFMLDGGCKPVERAHAKLRETLLGATDSTEAIQNLQQALIKNEKALRKYADL